MPYWQSTWLFLIAIGYLSPRTRPTYRVMAATGLMALASQGTVFGALAFTVSAAAAAVDLVLLVRSMAKA